MLSKVLQVFFRYKKLAWTLSNTHFEPLLQSGMKLLLEIGNMGVGGCNVPTLGKFAFICNRVYYIVVHETYQIKMNLSIYTD